MTRNTQSDGGTLSYRVVFDPYRADGAWS